MKGIEHRAVCLVEWSATLAVDREVRILHHLGMNQQGNQKVDSEIVTADSLTVQVRMTLVEFHGMG